MTVSIVLALRERASGRTSERARKSNVRRTSRKIDVGKYKKAIGLSDVAENRAWSFGARGRGGGTPHPLQ